MKHSPLRLLSLLLAAIFLSCGSRTISPLLLEIGEVAQSRDPLRAGAMLDSVDLSSLPENDLFFSDLLRLRIADKAETLGLEGYSLMDADTLIQPLLEYVEKKPDCGFYPEALYYAGRIYSVIGDSYRALPIFRKALKAVGKDSIDAPLQRKILSSAGALLQSVGRSDKAIDYFIEALRLDSILSDSLSMMADRKSLGYVYLRDKSYHLAKREFETARELAAKVSPTDTSAMDIYLSEIYYHTADRKEAIRRIRSALINIPAPYLNMALAEAALLYHSYGYSDTAAMYAVQLAWREEPSNLKIGASLLLSPDILKHVPADTLKRNFNRYSDWINSNLKIFSRETHRKKLMQTSLFNYSVHDRLREQAEKESAFYGYIAFGAGILALLFLVFFLITKSKKKQILLNLHESIEKVNSLNLRIDEFTNQGNTREGKDHSPDTSNPDTPEDVILLSQAPEPHLDNKEKERILIEKLKADLLSRFSDVMPGQVDYVIPKSLVKSDAYNALRRQIKSEKPPGQDSKIWKQLDKAVCKSFPDFKRNFTYLTGKGMTLTDYHTALLIKCALTPSEMAIMLSIEVSSVSSRRSYISKRIYGRNVGSATIDAIIRSL